MTRPSIALLLAGSFLFASPVYAQATAEQRAAADALYEEAGTLIKANRFAEACPKLETSQRLDPGTGTLLRLGYCYEQIGKTASAWSAYNEAEGMARKAGDKRADDAAARAKALEWKLVRLLLAVQSPIAGLEIRRDGKTVDSGLWGTAIPVDPGELVVEAIAPGKKPWKGTARIDPTPGSTTTIAIPALVDVENGAAVAPAQRPFWGGQRIAGIVLGGAGVVAIGVGLGFGASAKSTYNDSLTHCLPNDPTKCYAEGVTLRNDAYRLGNVATPIFVGGAIGLVAGTVLFFTAPSGPAKASSTSGHLQLQPSVGTDGAAVTLRGAW